MMVIIIIKSDLVMDEAGRCTRMECPYFIYKGVLCCFSYLIDFEVDLLQVHIFFQSKSHNS
jgi:hypothetical protein